MVTWRISRPKEEIERMYSFTRSVLLLFHTRHVELVLISACLPSSPMILGIFPAPFSSILSPVSSTAFRPVRTATSTIRRTSTSLGKAVEQGISGLAAMPPGTASTKRSWRCWTGKLTDLILSRASCYYIPSPEVPGPDSAVFYSRS